jgi:hypothetical protein
VEIDFTVPGRFDDIVMHINGHKYFINQDKDYEITFREGMVSWYDNVYKPIVEIVKNEGVLSRFPGRTAGDLYVWTVRHWDELKRKYGGSYSMRAAILDFSRRYGRSLWERVLDMLGRLFGDSSAQRR